MESRAKTLSREYLLCVFATLREKWPSSILHLPFSILVHPPVFHPWLNLDFDAVHHELQVFQCLLGYFFLRKEQISQGGQLHQMGQAKVGNVGVLEIQVL